MTRASLKTAQSIEGCVFAFTQSDEITYVLRNDQSLSSEPWFDNRIQKIASVIASMTSVNFMSEMCGPCVYFDARVFAVPNIQEAINNIIWRQQDCVKNSISSACITPTLVPPTCWNNIYVRIRHIERDDRYSPHTVVE